MVVWVELWHKEMREAPFFYDNLIYMRTNTLYCFMSNDGKLL